jgi:hypothetical protein
MSSVPIQIVRRQDKTLVDAVLHTELKAKVLVDTEKEWGPIRMAAARKLKRAGKIQDIPQHFHWDWGEKSQKLQHLAFQCLGIECDGKLQGLLMVKLVGQVARLAPDENKDVVYIDYLESAPWNLATMVDTPLYGGIGPLLMQAAVEVSLEEGFHGRIGSIPATITDLLCSIAHGRDRITHRPRGDFVAVPFWAPQASPVVKRWMSFRMSP